MQVEAIQVEGCKLELVALSDIPGCKVGNGGVICFKAVVVGTTDDG